MIKTVGIIANPASGRDIRRLVAYGAGTDNQFKVNIIRRVLVSLANMGVERVLYMPEYYAIVPRALRGIYSEHRSVVEKMEIKMADIEITQSEEDSTASARYMAEQGAACIITLGGDGTNRAVAKGSGNVPIIPISTGTNNVFPEMLEGTVAGLAAGAFAGGKLKKQNDMVQKNKQIEILLNDKVEDIALIDAVVVGEKHIGSRAVWTADQIRQVLVTRCNAHSIGISAIAGQQAEVSEKDPFGMLVTLNPSQKTLKVPLAPGLMEPIGVHNIKQVSIGEEIPLTELPCILALDGERSLIVPDGVRAVLRLSWSGPVVLNVEQVLRAVREQRLLYKG